MKSSTHAKNQSTKTRGLEYFVTSKREIVKPTDLHQTSQISTKQ